VRFRPVIPTTLAELPGMTDLASGLSTRHDYYIAEIDTLSKWRQADIAMPASGAR